MKLDRANYSLKPNEEDGHMQMIMEHKRFVGGTMSDIKSVLEQSEQLVFSNFSQFTNDNSSYELLSLFRK